MIGIYEIISPSNKVYIGQSLDIERRFKQYVHLHTSCKSQRYLYRSLKKYGIENHSIKMIEQLPKDSTQQEIDRMEILYWESYKNREYEMMNIKFPGSRGKWSEESKRKLSKALKGKKHSEEHIAKRRGKNNGMYGKRGKLAPFYGKHHSEEHKQMNRERMLGKKLSARKTINMDTGKIYDSVKEAAKDIGISYDQAKWLVRGQIKNRKINLLYYEDRDSSNSNE
jgi:group I intron endonuclease